MPDRDDFLRELHHRVKNNFQIIASLMNLQKRMLPPDRRGDLRFVEEHVQSMAVAYRIVSTTTELVQVPIEALVREVGDSLRQIAGAKPASLQYDLSQSGSEIELNQGIVLGLYLAVALPPYLDHIVANGGVVQVRTAVSDGELTLSITGDSGAAPAGDFMRKRLLDSYIRQLRGEAPEATNEGEIRLRFRLDPPRVGIARIGTRIADSGTTQAAPR
jgi:two-component sensor histidine kinase